MTHQPADVRHAAVIIGGGPSGLTAAYELTRLGWRPLVLEKHERMGGLARTEQFQGCHFDMGGHRFFTKSPVIQQIWRDVLGSDLLRRQRLSRIYYRRRYFYYPLRFFNALKGLGPVEAIRIFASYVRWNLFPCRPEDTFEQWVTNRFGQRLFQTFFRAYTEKVWGISCSELKAEWAAQRIKDLSLRSVLWSMIRRPGRAIRSLTTEFDYPRLGPGMMWNAVRKHIEARGGEVRSRTEVVRIHRAGQRIEAVDAVAAGREERVAGDLFISSMPITELVQRLDPPPPDDVLEAARQLRHRDFLTVCLLVNRADLFPDNWIYVHDPEVQVGRIQNFKNWSPAMVPDPTRTSLGLEYFCTQGDDLWNRSDAELVEQGKRELERIGLARSEEVQQGCVFRVAHAYPVYDSAYAVHLDVLRRYVDGLENFRTVGRNGLHRYNNQDHAMLTGLLAARSLALGERHDLWAVNTEPDYHEELRPGGAPRVNEPAPPVDAPAATDPDQPGQAAKSLVSIVIPARNCAADLRQCLASLKTSDFQHFEVIVVDDASTDGTAGEAAAAGARVLHLNPGKGPAAARNHGARAARGEFLLFLDADVCVHPSTLDQVLAPLHEDATVDAAFGSYDRNPTARNFLSQYRNLFHHFVHQEGRTAAATFWTGCGVVRRTAFEAVSGFDETFRRPTIEDIELGRRLCRAGRRIILRKQAQVVHLKRWTLGSILRTDIWDRGAPWTRLLLAERMLPNDLNLKWSQRLSVGFAAGLPGLAAWGVNHLTQTQPPGPGLVLVGALALSLVGAILLLNWRLYRFFVQQRGVLFATAAIPIHILYFWSCGLGLLIGLVGHLWHRVAGRRASRSPPGRPVIPAEGDRQVSAQQ